MVLEFNDPVSQVDNPARMAALFLVLNRTCFNGVYRVTKTGKFNAPWGLNSKLKFRSPEMIRDASWAFKDALIRQGSAMAVLRDLMPTLGPEDVVYLDPPYVPLDNKDSFLDYTSVGFGLEQQKEVAELFKEMASRGVCVVASNSDTPLTRKLYKGWSGKQVWAHRKVNANKLERGAVAELLVFSQRGSILDTPPPEVKQWPTSSKDTLLTDIFSDSDLI
jgi:DNA adenine methylase